MKNSIRAFLILSIIAVTPTSTELFAEETSPTPTGEASFTPAPTLYTTQPLIDADPLDQDRRKAISEFLALPLHRQKRTALPSLICKSILTQPTPSPNQIQLALALVESSLIPEIALQSAPSVSGKPPSTSNYLIDFSIDAVSLRSSTPRYESQALGISVPFTTQTKTVWLEAKNNMSTLFLVPPVGDCGFQFVVACPRVFSSARSLEDSHLEISGVRYHVEGKADGLFQAPPGKTGRVFAGILASPRITLPAAWMAEDTSSDTPNASIRIRRETQPTRSSLNFQATSAPFADAIEARLEFGTPAAVERTVRSRATLDVSRFHFETTQKVEVENSEILLTPGDCFVISQRKETHY